VHQKTPAGGAYNALPNPLAGFQGDTTSKGKMRGREENGGDWREGERRGAGHTVRKFLDPPLVAYLH